MAAPKTAKEASAQLLDLNAKVHAAMGDLGVQELVVEDWATVPYQPILNAEAAGKEAISILEAVKPSAPELKSIKLLTAAITKTIEFYPQEEGKVTLPAILAADLNNKIMNNLANQIHDAAMNLIGATGEIGGCKVGELMPDEALAVSKYCSGVIPTISKATVTKVPTKSVTVDGKKKIIKNPQLILHKLGLHHAEVSPLSKDGTAQVAIEYHDSVGYPDSANRLEGVRQRLIKEGFECHKQPGNVIYCWNEVDKEKLTRLAAFFSLLLNADVSHLGKDTVPVVSEKAWDIAVKLVQKHADETYKSAYGQVNWYAAHQEWLQEKEIYQKQKIYKDLRDIVILRDKHHQLIEEAYHVEALHAPGLVVKSLEGVKKVVKNAQEALAIFKKNNWSYHGLESAISNLDNAVKKGQTHGLMPLVDHIGNTMHTSSADVLIKEGTYGGCTTGDVYNINAANLAYCEGVLKGTSANLTKAGNMAIHKVAPKSYQAFILDENPQGGYNVTLTLPEPTEWSATLKKFLEKHDKFKCTGNKCSAYIKNLEDIRMLALLLSNLRGASEAIGDKCIPKAIELATETAKAQNEKGVFAFTQEPVMASSKAWIDLCFKKHGITPPGLTEEDKKTLETIGAEKVYYGCSFAETETLPGKGILIYCEGIRKNPKGKVSAHLMNDGKLIHYFHDELDDIAMVNITSLGGDKYQVELGSINMHGQALQNAVIKQLKNLDFTCPTHNSCSAELSDMGIRNLAVFLSSLHQAYKPGVNAQAAVDYVIKQIATLPQDKSVHDVMVYPFAESEWIKVLGKAPPEKVKAPPKAVEEKPLVTTWPGYGPTPKPPFAYAGCTSLTKAKPTQVKKTYCTGVIGEVDNLDFEIPGMLKGTAAILSAKENKHHVGGPLVLFDSSWNTLIVTLPPELLKVTPLVARLKNSPYDMTQEEQTGLFKTPFGDVKAQYVARLLSYCSGIHTLPESCWEKAVKHASILAVTAGKPPIHPYLEKDWLKEICGVAPPEKKPKLTPAQLEKAILDFMKPESPAEWHTGQEIFAWLKKYYDVTIEKTAEALAKLQNEGIIIYEGGKYKLIEKPPLIDIKTFKWEEPFESYIFEGFTLVVPKAHIVKLVSQGISKDELVSLLTHVSVEPYGTLGVKAAKELADLYMPEKKLPKLAPGDLKTQVLKVYQAAPENKTDYPTLVKAIQTYYDVESGPAHKVGTIAWANDQLLHENTIIYLGGTTYGLAPEFPLKPKKEVLYEELSPIEKSSVKTKMLDLINKGWGKIDILKKIREEFNLALKGLPAALDEVITLAEAKKPIVSLDQLKSVILKEIEKYPGIMMTPSDMYEALLNAGWKINYTLKDVEMQMANLAIEGEISPVPGGYVYKPEKPTLTFAEIESFVLKYLQKKYEELPVADQQDIHDEILFLIEEGDYVDQSIGKKIIEKYGLESTDSLWIKIHQMLTQYKLGKPGMKSIKELSPSELQEAQDFILEKMKEGLSVVVIESLLADHFPGGIIQDSEYEKWVGEQIEKWQETYPELTEKEIYLHYSEYPKEKQAEISGSILAKVQKDMGFKTIKEQLEYEYPELEWDEEIETIVKATISEWKAEAGKEKPPPVSAVAEAINIIKGGKPYAGCHPDKPGVKISPQQAVYCEGIKTPPMKKKAGYVQEMITAKGGIPIVSQYGDGYNVMATSEGPGITLTFKDIKKGKEWKTRQIKIAEQLVEELGYECSFMDDHFLCNKYPLDTNKADDRDLVRTSAIFLSGLHAVDELDRACIGDAVRHALNKAKDANINLQAQAYKDVIYPFTKKEWDKEVCEPLFKKPEEVKAAAKAKELGTTKLLELANAHGIDPTGSDKTLALKLIKAGIIDPQETK